MTYDKKKVEEALQSLDQLTYIEWFHIQNVMNSYMRAKKNECERTITIDSNEVMERFGRSLPKNSF